MQRRDQRFGLQARLSSLSAPQGTDLVFDFSDAGAPAFREMALVLTARQMAEGDRGRVWVTDLPHRTWKLLGALGLADLFEPFPSSTGHVH